MIGNSPASYKLIYRETEIEWESHRPAGTIYRLTGINLTGQSGSVLSEFKVAWAHELKIDSSAHEAQKLNRSIFMNYPLKDKCQWSHETREHQLGSSREMVPIAIRQMRQPTKRHRNCFYVDSVPNAIRGWHLRLLSHKLWQRISS